MKPNEKYAKSQFSAGVSFQANGDARFVSQNVRDIGSQFKAEMSRRAKCPPKSKEGYVFEYLDAMDQQVNLGGKYKFQVPGVNGKNSPDIQIKSRTSGDVVREQQLKRYLIIMFSLNVMLFFKKCINRTLIFLKVSTNRSWSILIASFRSVTK